MPQATVKTLVVTKSYSGPRRTTKKEAEIHFVLIVFSRSVTLAAQRLRFSDWKDSYEAFMEKNVSSSNKKERTVIYSILKSGYHPRAVLCQVPGDSAPVRRS